MPPPRRKSARVRTHLWLRKKQREKQAARGRAILQTKVDYDAAKKAGDETAARIAAAKLIELAPRQFSKIEKDQLQ